MDFFIAVCVKPVSRAPRIIGIETQNLMNNIVVIYVRNTFECAIIMPGVVGVEIMDTKHNEYKTVVYVRIFCIFNNSCQVLSKQ